MTGIHLQKVEPEENCFRYYEISLEDNLFGDRSLVVRWGRIGRLGRERIAASGKEETLAVMASKLTQTKLKRGYCKS
jgi:predicted DNA-binding WGR domain protein